MAIALGLAAGMLIVLATLGLYSYFRIVHSDPMSDPPTLVCVELDVPPRSHSTRMQIVEVRSEKFLPADGFDGLELIGSGSYGNVYKAWYEPHGVPILVALKHVVHCPPNIGAKVARREAKILSCFNHPHIVHLCGVCLEPDKLCILLEFVERGSLRSVLDAGVHLERPIQYRLAMGMTCGLAALHRRGFLQ